MVKAFQLYLSFVIQKLHATILYMTKINISILVGVVLIATVGFLAFNKKDKEVQVTQNPPIQNTTSSTTETQTSTTATTTSSVNTNTPPPAKTTTSITSTQVATHNTSGSCWTTINGNVYDLTSWISKHPGGGQAILQLCGTDGSTKFNAQHGGSPKQETILSGFKIGTASN